MDTIQQPVVQALARALVHFLWQGAALALLTSVGIRILRPSAPIRYALGVLCLAAMAAAPIVTTTIAIRTSRAADAGATSAISVKTAPTVFAAAASTAPAISAVMAMNAGGRVGAALVVLWLTGVLVLSARLVGGWMLTRRLVARARGLAAPEIRALARRVADRLALARAVEVLESSTVSVPMMIGWIAPVVILPAAAMAALTPTQIEALLAHELAHVRRHDYLVNLLQSVVETLLFYHPAVWWISRDVREAREHCCDDLAVAVCDRVVYVSALADLAAMTATPRFALAATDGSLVTRVRRILGGDSRRPSRPEWLPASLLILGAVAVVPVVAMSRQTPQAPPSPQVQTEVRVVESADARTPSAVLVARPQEAATENSTDTPRLAQDDRIPLSEPPMDDQPQAKLDALRDRLALIQAERDASTQLTAEQARALDEETQRIRMALERLEELRDKTADLARVKQDQLRTVSEQLDAEVRAIKQARESEDLPRKKEIVDRQAKELSDVAKLSLGTFAALAKVNAEQKEDEIARAKARQDGDQQYIEKLRNSLAEAEVVAERARAKETRLGNVDGIDEKTALSLLGQARGDRATVLVVAESTDGRGVSSASIKSVHWESGTTVRQALERAGFETTNSKVDVSRLSSLNLSLQDGETQVSGRAEAVGLDVVLRQGDILVVSGGGK